MIDAWNSSHALARTWRAGAWSIELRSDELAEIAYDAVPLLRAVRAVIRDRDWDTATTVVERVTEEGCALILHIRSEGLGSSFKGTIHVEADDRQLIIGCDLRSTNTFMTNRTGLVVLHPPSLAGTEVTVTHPTGTETVRIPESISPHQPVRNITGIGWSTAGIRLRLDLEGDVFEMEDQRNWTDASFKTYSRPLDLPFPYEIAPGEHVRQVLRLIVEAGDPSPTTEIPASIELRPTGSPFPSVGLGAATGTGPARPATGGVGHLLVELDLASPSWRRSLDRAVLSGAQLDVRILLDAERPATLDVAAMALVGLPVIRVTAFPTSGPAAHISDRATVEQLRVSMRHAGLDAPVVGGTRAHFTELNREQSRLPDGLAGIVFSSTPLFHATTTEQLVESIAMQRLVAEQAVAIADGLPVHIGPITLRPRFNNVRTAPPPPSRSDEPRESDGPVLTDAADGRQSSPELAAWTIASAAALTVPGVQSLTYFEEWGPRGVRSEEDEPYPVAAAIEALSALMSGEALSGSSPDGLIWAIGAGSGAERTLLVANLDQFEREIIVEAPGWYQAVTVPASSFSRV